MKRLRRLVAESRAPELNAKQVMLAVLLPGIVCTLHATGGGQDPAPRFFLGEIARSGGPAGDGHEPAQVPRQEAARSDLRAVPEHQLQSFDRRLVLRSRGLQRVRVGA